MKSLEIRTCRACCYLGLVLLLGLLASPTLAFDYIWDCRGEDTTWDNDNVTFQPRLDSFPAGSAWRTSLESARDGWNNRTPSSEFRFTFAYAGGNAFTAGDGVNNIAVTNAFAFNGALAVTLTRRNKGCPIWPFSRPRMVEADILFDPSFNWDNATTPGDVVPCFGAVGACTFNSTIVALHEMGHAFGLDHDNNILGTMDAVYPDAGPLGNGNQVHPHADDVRGNISGYGFTPTFGPWQRDVAATAYRRLAGTASSEPIPAPNFDRGVARAVQFTIENRSLYNQNNVRVQFYLSTNRFISSGDILIGSTTLNMPAFFTGTLTANVTVPATVVPGQYFFGYLLDGNSQIAEINEGNNAVAYRQPSTVTANNVPPTACFNATPDIGDAPLLVTFDASCSSDIDGTIVSYNWTMGDGGVRTGQNLTYSYNDGGFFQATLTVRDNNGASRSTSWFIEVFEDCVPGELCTPF